MSAAVAVDGHIGDTVFFDKVQADAVDDVKKQCSVHRKGKGIGAGLLQVDIFSGINIVGFADFRDELLLGALHDAAVSGKRVEYRNDSGFIGAHRAQIWVGLVVEFPRQLQDFRFQFGTNRKALGISAEDPADGRGGTSRFPCDQADACFFGAHFYLLVNLFFLWLNVS